MSFRIAVIGGGIAGLAASHRLLELGAARGIPLDLTLLEAGPRLGGTIATERAGDPGRACVIEAGPDALLAAKPWGLDLCGRLGLSGRLIGTQPASRRTFVAHRGRLHPLPEGFALLAPSRFAPVLRSRLFTWRGKTRMAMDLVLPRRRGEADESLGHFVTRRFGREVLERVAQPMVAGIYTADPETLSLAATMPRFLELERRYGSVIRGLRRTRGRSKAREAGGFRGSLFVAPAGGMGELVSALAAHLAGATVRLGMRVRSIEPEQGGSRYRLAMDDGSLLHAEAVIVATEAHRAARLLDRLDPALASMLGAVPYASSAAVTLAYRRDQVAHPLDGSGFVVPAAEGRPLIACTFSSVKFAGRAPEGAVLLRAFFGGALRPGVLKEEDSELAGLAQRELASLLGIRGVPQLVRVHRHPLAMPQYLVGHLDRVAAIEAQASRHTGLALAGGAYRGVGIPDCIRSGEQAAECILSALTR
jgi:oxygen-dependent protoporphyrinogen oxidase